MKVNHHFEVSFIRSYTYIVFTFQLLAIGNYILLHNTSGYDQIIPFLFGVVLVPLAVVMGLVQFGLEFKYPNQAMVMKYITKALTPIVIIWAVYILATI